MLRRPKAASIRNQNRASISSYAPISRNRTESIQLPGARMRSNSSLNEGDGGGGGEGGGEEVIEHAVESRMVTAELPPVMSKVVDEHPMSWVGFEEECIVTACGEGHVRVWRRPVDVGVGGG